LVSLDQSAKTMTVEARVEERVFRYIDQFKPGDRVMLTWTVASRGEAGPVLHVARDEEAKNARLDYGHILPVELVSSNADARSITFKAQVPASTLESLNSMQPGGWAKVTTPLQQANDTAVIVAVDRSEPPLETREAAPQTDEKKPSR
jgi:hypothetical protein